MVSIAQMAPTATHNETMSNEPWQSRNPARSHAQGTDELLILADVGRELRLDSSAFS